MPTRASPPEGKVAAALGTTRDDVLIHNLAVHAVSRGVYLAVSRGGEDWNWTWNLPNDLADATILLRLDGEGEIREVPLTEIRHARAELPNPVAAEKTHRWKEGLSLRVDTITDLAYADGVVYVAGLSNEEFASTMWKVPFPFGGDISATGPAVLGRLGVEDGVLRFRPRLPFRPGLGYRAVFDGAALDRLLEAPPGSTPVLELRFTPPPAPPAPLALVEAVYPSADTLPENQLRLYVWFSHPMRRRGVAGRLRLIEVDSGEAVEPAFVEVSDGLWDPSGRRLTLFFHPGRVKRGVGPQRALGPPLRSGGRYRLEIDPQLRDARGRPLGEGHVKEFAVGPADRRSPDPARWMVSAPREPGSALEVDFGEPLDHGLLLRLLEVLDGAGRPVPGRAAVSAGESRWSFVPRAPWRAGPYRLRVSTALEDLAGNNLERRFDEETTGGRAPRAPARTPVELEFTGPEPGPRSEPGPF